MFPGLDLCDMDPAQDLHTVTTAVGSRLSTAVDRECPRCDLFGPQTWRVLRAIL